MRLEELLLPSRRNRPGASFSHVVFGVVPAATRTLLRRKRDDIVAAARPGPCTRQRHDRAAIVGDGLDRVEILRELDALFQCLDDLLVIEPVGGRVLQCLPVRDRDAAPRPNQAGQTGSLGRALRRAPAPRE